MFINHEPDSILLFRNDETLDKFCAIVQSRCKPRDMNTFVFPEHGLQRTQTFCGNNVNGLVRNDGRDVEDFARKDRPLLFA